MGAATKPRAVVFDFNGTLSHDEQLICRIFADLFAERGRPMSEEDYFGELAGLSDPEIVRGWLGADYPDVKRVVGERVERYLAAVADGSTVEEPMREAVRYTVARVPVGVVSSAFRREIDAVLGAAGLRQLVSVIVSVDEVPDAKPSPAPYLRALELFGDEVRGEDVLALEDTEAGIASAKAAGLRCLGVLGTLEPHRLAAADEVVATVDVALIRRLLA